MEASEKDKEFLKDLLAMDGKVKDCVGCGFCCTQTKCGAGNRLYPAAEVCGALKWDGERHVCDLMTLPGSLGDMYRKELYAGEGCCSNLNSWRREELKDRTKRIKVDGYNNPVPSIMQKFLAALGKQMISGDMLSLTLGQFEGYLEKDGMDPEEIQVITSLCASYLTNQKSKFMSEFMG